MCGQPSRRSAIGGRQPQIATVAEDHLVAMNIRVAQQSRSFFGLNTCSHQQEAQQASKPT
jgi:hypothetical protein